LPTAGAPVPNKIWRAPRSYCATRSNASRTARWRITQSRWCAAAEKALRLNPYDPNVAAFYWSLGMCHLLLGDADQAIELLTRARASNPRLFYVHLWLAGALGFKGDVDQAHVALAEAIALKPEINSFARLREYQPWITNPPYWALREKTVNVGLRRADFREE
jgi:tetratricopeptide (TPR) repeat protein